MKRFLILLVIPFVFLASCATSKYLEDPQTKKMVLVEPYGLFNMNTKKNPNVIYEISAGTVICSIVFFESVVIPVIGVGYKLWEPVYFTNTNSYSI